MFHRRFQGYSGGHGKVWDYFRHASAHPGWNAAVHFAEGADAPDNPWRPAVAGLEEWRPQDADALFLAGMDWQAWPGDDPAKPVINLIQHVRHADQDEDVHPFLGRPAIRICVSQQVADAILATGRVHGPVRVIEAALDLPSKPCEQPRTGIVIGAIKQPELGMRLANALRLQGLHVRLLDRHLPRAEYLATVAGAEVAVLLPRPTEGFYLPALEAMALGCAVATCDCIGNRAYLEPGVNALVADSSETALTHAVLALHRDKALRARLAANGLAAGARFGMACERAALHAILDDLQPLWADAWAATSH